MVKMRNIHLKQGDAMRNTLFISRIVLIVFCVHVGLITGDSIGEETDKKQSAVWTESFNLEECSFSTVGETKYFILKPGYQLILEG